MIIYLLDELVLGYLLLALFELVHDDVAKLHLFLEDWTLVFGARFIFGSKRSVSCTQW